MAILFVPNDLLALARAPARRKAPRPDPPAGQARFSLPAAPPEAPHPIGSLPFLHWQCREAALATLELWGEIDRPLRAWQNGKRALPLLPNAGPGINARYDRKRIAFFRSEFPARRTAVAASTDAVAHEVGHALLDAIRPDLWESFYPECAAFHEAFGDCISLLVGFSDTACRKQLVASGALATPNFLEALAEDSAAGLLAEEGSTHPHSAPRRALNSWQWKLPLNLPLQGPPKLLSAEPHSFGQIFTGCFYDLIRALYTRESQSSAGLLSAATQAARLLVSGVRAAPAVARFFQAVGRAMVLHDEAQGGGRHLAIRDAFLGHGIALGSSAAFAPTASLGAPSVSPGAVSLVGPAALQLRARLGARASGRLRVSRARQGPRGATAVHHRREVPLRHRKLRGVVVAADECVMLGDDAGRAVILGSLPDSRATADEVDFYSRLLVESGALEDAPGPASKRRRRGQHPQRSIATHRIRKRGSRTTIRRSCFSCRTLPAEIE